MLCSVPWKKITGQLQTHPDPDLLFRSTGGEGGAHVLLSEKRDSFYACLLTTHFGLEAFLIMFHVLCFLLFQQFFTTTNLYLFTIIHPPHPKKCIRSRRSSWPLPCTACRQSLSTTGKHLYCCTTIFVCKIL